MSIATTAIATITHPLVGYENETVVWARYLREGFFQPTIARRYGLGRGWGGIWPFLLAAGGGVVLARWATPRLQLTNATLGYGLLALIGWALFAALGPTVLGIDHAGLLSIVEAGDHTALNLTLHDGGRYPLKALAPLAAVAGCWPCARCDCSATSRRHRCAWKWSRARTGGESRPGDRGRSRALRTSFKIGGAVGAFMDQAGRRGMAKRMLVARASRHVAIQRRVQGRIRTCRSF